MKKIIATSLIAMSLIAGVATAVSANTAGSDFSGYPQWAQDAFVNQADN